MSFFSSSLQNKQDSKDLLTVSLDSSDEKSSILGSWVCTHWVEKDKQLFQNALPQIVLFLENGTHQSSLRSFMKVLTYLEIDEAYQGRVIDLCAHFISESHHKVALHVYCIHVLAPLMKLYPELYPEINALIELHSINKSPAYHAGYRHFRKTTKKNHTL